MPFNPAIAFSDDSVSDRHVESPCILPEDVLQDHSDVLNFSHFVLGADASKTKSITSFRAHMSVA